MALPTFGGDLTDSVASGSRVPANLENGIESVPVRWIVPGRSPRLEGENEDHIMVLVESEEPLPPILVHRRSMQVIDGMHRLRAAVLRGDEEIRVRFFDGSDFDAFTQAVKANIAHGLPLTAADRRAAAGRILQHHPEWSNRAIAVATGLASRTVAFLRRELTDGSGNAVAAATVRVGRDGRIRPLDIQERRRAASDLIEGNPDASLREVARAVGISPATVRDVRERMRQGSRAVRSGRRATADQQGGKVDHAVSRGAGVGKESILENLRRDPSLRYTESGRAFVRWLTERSQGPGAGMQRADGIPPHCAFLVARLARACATEWAEFAAVLERTTARAH